MIQYTNPDPRLHIDLLKSQLRIFGRVYVRLLDKKQIMVADSLGKELTHLRELIFLKIKK